MAANFGSSIIEFQEVNHVLSGGQQNSEVERHDFFEVLVSRSSTDMSAYYH